MLGKAPDSHSEGSEFDLYNNFSIHKLKLSPLGIQRILAHNTKNTVTCMSDYRWGLDWRFDLLTNYTHNL
jgi:hypothetical protein